MKAIKVNRSKVISSPDRTRALLSFHTMSDQRARWLRRCSLDVMRVWSKLLISGQELAARLPGLYHHDVSLPSIVRT